MTRSFYIATRKDRAGEADAVAEALGRLGWRRTFAWSAVNSADAFSQVAVDEVNGVRDADVLLVLLPGGFGTHVEIGVALALGKPIVIHARDRETLNTPYPCLFHYHPNVTLLVSDRVDVDAVVSAAPDEEAQPSGRPRLTPCLPLVDID